MRDATRVALVVVGDVHLSFNNDRSLLLKDCLYAPSIRRNLISVSCLAFYGYSVSFNKLVVIKKNKSFICSGTLVDNIYIVNPISPTQQINILHNSIGLNLKRNEPSLVNQMYIWHLRLVILI